MTDPRRSPVLLATDVDALLRRCVQCGLCLPHCATYLVTGSEVQSPRGRLLLLGEQLARPEEGCELSFLEAFDQCIGCRACETACPGGVPFSLLEQGQEQARARLPRSTQAVAGVPAGGALLRRMDSRPWLSTLHHLGRLGRGLLSGILGRRWRGKLQNGPLARLGQLLGSMPRSLESDQGLLELLDALCRTANRGPALPEDGGQAQPTTELARRPVVLFRGCANEGLLPASTARLKALLAAAGYEVLESAGQNCCGALATHTGRPGRAAALHHGNAQALSPLLSTGVPLLVEAAGCGVELKEKMPAPLAAAATDLTVFLADAALPPLGSLPLRVVYHDPCHARHGQGIVDQPRRLLRRIPGLTLLATPEAEVCCGSGGAWGLGHPELSAQAGRRKARLLAATAADVVVTSNPGCLGQLADGLALEAPDLPILPLSDLLWCAWRRAGSSPR